MGPSDELHVRERGRRKPSGLKLAHRVKATQSIGRESKVNKREREKKMEELTKMSVQPSWGGGGKGRGMM